MSLGKKISELPVATTLTGLELAVVVQTSTTKQSTPEAITASVSSRLDNVVSVNNAALTSINNVVSALEIRVSAVSARASVNAAAITSINAEVSLKVYRTGDYMTNARYIEFDTSASNGLTTGKLAWNSNDGTLDVGLLGGTVLQVGQETLFYVKNAHTTTIPDGKLVMATGVVGNSGKIEANLADGSGAVSPEYFLGITTQDIASGDFGYVTQFGLVRGINATGSQYGETWAQADLLYANASIAGGLTNSPPAYPGISTPLAIVVNAVSNAGSIFVRMKTGEYLQQLHDVDISTKASGDIITWNSTIGAWTNSQAFVSAQADIAALEIRVSAVSAAASANAAAITSVNNVVSALEVRVSNASAINTTQTAAITSINNVVSALEIRVSAASAQAAINAAAITSINNVVSALEIRVSGVSAALVSINNVVSALSEQVSAVNTSVINAAFVSINNVVSALEVRVSGVSATTSTLTAAITSVNAVVSLKVNRSGDTMTSTLAAPNFKINSTGGGSVLLAVVSTASSVVATFPATTGNIITSGDSGSITQGMLATNVVGKGPAFGAYLSTNQNVTSNVLTKVQINTEEFDTNTNYDNSTNYRFTPTVAGYYQIEANIIVIGGSMTVAFATIYKNGSEFKRGGQISFNSGNASVFGSAVAALIYLNGSTDYVELYGQGTGTSPYFLGGQQFTWFSGVLVRAA